MKLESRLVNIERGVQAIGEKQQAGNDKVDKLEKRLYIDNGVPSIQTRLDRSDRNMSVIMWVFGLAIAALIANTVRIAYGG